MNLCKLSLISLLSIAIFSCGGGGSGEGATGQSYIGPGSEWTMTRTGNTYNLVKTFGSASVSVTATGTTLGTGHTKLVVTSSTATGGGTPATVGDIVHGFDIPGVAFFLAASDSNDVIVMVDAGNCPSSNFTANWIVREKAFNPGTGDTATSTNSDWFGDVSWNVSTGVMNSFSDYSLETNSALNSSPAGNVGACANGTVTNAALKMKVYFTDAGMAIIVADKDDPSEAHLIAIPQQSVTSLSDFYGNYIGFSRADALGGGEEINAVTASFGSNGANADLAITPHSGNDLTIPGASMGTVSFNRSSGVNTPLPGFLRGAFGSCTGGGDAGGATDVSDNICDVSCAIAKNVHNSGKNFIYCTGQRPADEDRSMTVFLVSQ